MSQAITAQEIKANAAAIRSKIMGAPKRVNIISEIRAKKRDELLEQVRRDEEKAAKAREARANREAKRIAAEEAAERQRAANKVVSEFKLVGSITITEPDEETAIGNIYLGRASGQLATMESIANTILQQFDGLTMEHVRNHNRSEPLVSIRKIIAREIHKRLKKSSTQIGRFMNREHTAVLYMIGATRRGKEALERTSHKTHERRKTVPSYDIDKVREEYASGTSTAKIARDYKISPKTVRRLARTHGWSRVGEMG